MHAYMGAVFFAALGICAALHAGDPREDVWETTGWVWNFGIIQSCDKGLDQTPLAYFQYDPPLFRAEKYRNIQTGDVVWIQCRYLPYFYHDVLPEIENRFVLIVSDGDESFPSNSGLLPNEVEDFLQNKNVGHLFAQNCDYLGPSKKVSHLPIGMDFHTVAYKGVEGGWREKGTPLEHEADLNLILDGLLPTSERVARAFVDFQHSDTMHAGFNRYLEFGEDRTSIFNTLVETGLIDYDGFLRRTDLWKRKGNYAFSISPHGNGLDCTRTWEDLVLGCIVIVKTSSLDPLYEGLPVVIVNDWSEITPENFEKWQVLYGDAFTNPEYREKLTNGYWIHKIQEKAKGLKK